MNAIKQIFVKHPFSVIGYLLHFGFCCLVCKAAFRYQQFLKDNPGHINISFGEGVMYGYFFLAMITVVFVMIICANVIARKENKFYLWLLLVVIVQTALVFATLAV